jgi:hypothetical protein
MFDFLVTNRGDPLCLGFQNDPEWMQVLQIVKDHLACACSSQKFFTDAKDSRAEICDS